ncbi:Uncharacterised protein [Klebsiella pneumoniae]|nr:Uncharacterised protein [Klebsiella pneumoniae]
MAYLRQVFFRQTGHFHDGTAVNTAAEHGTGNFELAFIAAFFDTTLFTELNPLLDALLFKLLSDGHKCVPVLRHTQCQFAYKGFGVGCFACLHDIVYQRYDL